MLIFLGFLFWPQKAQALAWYENLITDNDFTRKSSMSLSQIQNFLNSRESILKNYSWNGKSASRWIYDESQRYGISPQVILVTLQKEEGLISITQSWCQQNPTSCKTRLSWAMGYDAYAGGYDPDYKGFGNQIHYAARWFRAKFNDGQGPSSYHVGDTALITYRSWEPKKIPVYLSNRATAALYRYTPYVYNGNYNFSRLGRAWFNWRSFAPVLYRIQDGDGKVYLIDSNRKMLIPDEAMMTAWGFSFNQVFNKSATVVNNIPTGPTLTRLVKGSQTGIFFVDLGFRKHIPNSPTFNKLGFNLNDVRTISGRLLTSLPSEGDITGLIKSRSTGKKYYINQGKAYLIANNTSFQAWNFRITSLSSLRDINYFLNNKSAYGTISYIVKDSSANLWLGSWGYKYLILDPAVIGHWGLDPANVPQAPQILINSRPKAGNLTRLVRGGKSGKIWFLRNGRIQWVPDPATFAAFGFSRVGLWRINSAILNLKPVGPSLSAVVKSPGGKRIYLTQRGRKRWIVNSEAFYGRGLTSGQIKTVSLTAFQAVPRGIPIFYLAQSPSGRIYLIYQRIKRPFRNYQSFKNWGFIRSDIRQVSYQQLGKYRTGHSITSLIKGSGSAIYYLQNGKKRWISTPEVFAKYSFKWSQIIRLDQRIVSEYRSGSPLK